MASLSHGRSPAPDTALVEIGTEWMSHREFSVARDRDVTDCGGTLKAVRRTATTQRSSVLEIECTGGCMFETTASDDDFRRAQERRGDDVGDDWRWWQR